tara:strand:- start:86 stop:415 length:330 start_codon:yes stop_codon:yes gene_type:complete
MIINSNTGVAKASKPDTPEKASQRLVDLDKHNHTVLEDNNARHLYERGAAWQDDLSATVAGPVSGVAALWLVIGELIDALEAVTPEASRTVALKRLMAAKALIETSNPI